MFGNTLLPPALLFITSPRCAPGFPLPSGLFNPGLAFQTTSVPLRFNKNPHTNLFAMENKCWFLNPIAAEASASSAVLGTESGTNARQKTLPFISKS